MIKFQTKEEADAYNQLVVEHLRALVGEDFKATEYSVITEKNGEFYMDNHVDIVSEIGVIVDSMPQDIVEEL